MRDSLVPILSPPPHPTTRLYHRYKLVAEEVERPGGDSLDDILIAALAPKDEDGNAQQGIFGQVALLLLSAALRLSAHVSGVGLVGLPWSSVI